MTHKKPVGKVRPVVVVDIALLGEAELGKTHARGVHRVAERIVGGLAASNQCELRFVATSSLAAARRAIAARGLQPKPRLFYHPYQMALSKCSEKAGVWITRTLSNRRFFLRLLRRGLQCFSVWADEFSRSIPTLSLVGADIYHSPLGPIPNKVNKRSGLKKFLTVVDVIPLTNPDSVGGRGVQDIKTRLDSLKGPNCFAFCISETVKEDLLRIKEMSAEDIFVTPLAASPEWFHPVPEKEVVEKVLEKYRLPKKPYFLALSSFDPRKNFGHVIRSFSALLKRPDAPDANLVIVGSNPERNDFVEQAKRREAHIPDRIHTPGYLPDIDLAAVYAGAIAFLFPSLSEGFGMPVLEAMQCGLPVISSNVPALPEIVGGAGILLDPKDQDRWVEAMLAVATSQELRNQLTSAGFQRAGCFSWQRFTNAVLEGYRTALGNQT